MSNSNEVENGSDDDLLQKPKRKVDQESRDESERLNILTSIVLEGLVNRLVTEPTEVTMEKKGIKRCHQGENQDYLFHKQKKQKTRKNNKEEKKRNPNPKKVQAKTMQKLAELGLEPPPDMPEASKICIQDMGGTEIKLIQVVFVDPRVVVSELNLNKWDVGKTSSSYVLNGPWFKNVVKNNEDSLKPTAVVQIWSFRVGTNSKLGFALVKVRDEEQD